jgi:GNAT superfamily N-acetyltransferase
MFLKAHQVHYHEFAKKASLYEDCAVVVCEYEGDIVAVACAGIKDITIFGKPERAGYIFDVRVDQRVQGKGVGAGLSRFLEDRCRSRGATYLYLSVNSTNLRAISLYKKTGFTIASTRIPCMMPTDVELYSDELHASQAAAMQAVPMATAIELTSDYWLSQDLCVKELPALFGSALYEGTFVLRDSAEPGGDESWAMASLWNGSALGGMQVDRIFLPMSWWRVMYSSGDFWYGRGSSSKAGSRKAISQEQVERDLDNRFNALQAVVGVAGGAILGYRYRAAPPKTNTAARMVDMLLVGGLVGAGLSLRRVYPHVKGRLSWYLRMLQRGTYHPGRPPPKFRCRVFAPVVHGPRGKALLRELVKQARQKANERGYPVLVYNADQNDPLRTAFPNGDFYTTFMHKSLREVGRNGLDHLAPTNFFDPRDM